MKSDPNFSAATSCSELEKLVGRRKNPGVSLAEQQERFPFLKDAPVEHAYAAGVKVRCSTRFYHRAIVRISEGILKLGVFHGREGAYYRSNLGSKERGETNFLGFERGCCDEPLAFDSSCLKLARSTSWQVEAT